MLRPQTGRVVHADGVEVTGADELRAALQRSLDAQSEGLMLKVCVQPSRLSNLLPIALTQGELVRICAY